MPNTKKFASRGNGNGSGRARAAGQTASAKSKHATRKTKWSAKVMADSDAMDLKPGVFKLASAPAIARSLKKSAEASKRRKSTPFRSAMSMLTFEINRGGTNLSASRVSILNKAKQELRRLYDRPLK